MALVKETLQTTLTTIFSQENSASEAAEAIASAIDDYIKSASVVGTCSAGPVTGYLE